MHEARKIGSSIAIGVHVHAEPERLRLTLESLRRNTVIPVELVLLPDGADGETQRFLTGIDLKQLATAEPRGAAACFNRLCASTGAEVVVLLESGCLAAPGWLDHLLTALAADPSHGLAGPSTNRAWNEQGVFPRTSDAFEDIAETAAEALRRFGSTWQTLAPLYSLADFCYAVRREVIDTVGAADEGYGRGPCWEMDYNIRAARAGFTGVWARAAYVHRAPFTARRTRDDAELMEASKRRYQGKFCGRQLRNGTRLFRSHCRGDACPNFALVPKRLTGSVVALKEHRAPVSLPTTAPATPSSGMPLVSCVMPTADRRAFIPDAIRCFQSQDYPNLELVVVDDGEDPIGDCMPADRRIRYMRLDARTILGKKRNLACEAARGEFVIHWDDDDWYPPHRVRTQVEALQRNNASVCGTSRLYFEERSGDRAWEYGYAGHRWVAGSSLAYRRDFWRRHPFAEIREGEDNLFLRPVAAPELVDLNDPSLCIASIHAGNTSRKVPGKRLWKSCSPRVLQALRERAESSVPAATGSGLPLVSCIMPTHNRRPFVPLTLENFRCQTYPNRELIIVDDGSEPIADLLAGWSDVRYVQLPGKVSIGRKRNIACEYARGDLIAHWDDDDWYGPDRLEKQVSPIIRNAADLTGLQNGYMMVLPDAEFWCLDPALHQRMFVGDVPGGTLVFRRSLWQSGLRYPDISLAEDAAFLNCATRRGARLTKIENTGLFIYVRHGRNTWKFDPGRFVNPRGWCRVGAPAWFEPSLQIRYQTAARGDMPSVPGFSRVVAEVTGHRRSG